ncbi:tigger transposable element-derived protein 6 [Plakobranchus ocellatus]|uniref:Tigger transposable element-derived protein 6 n=1 Tax=Plakobranchus ocellatus TaxID=259542 RepID=A0AAV3YG69_9GAST|nr:tigger transposable element-derived protein 6 [Plakobranchus ocellatus]
MKVTSSEVASAPTETTLEWREKKLQEVLHSTGIPCNEEDIFLTQTKLGSSTSVCPTRLAMKGDTCAAQKISKGRISFLVAANMDGSQRQRFLLLFIGKF